MKAGDILLFKAEKGWLSRLIAWGTGSVYTHVAVCVSPELDLAIEAMTRGGVRARAISKIADGYDIYRVKDFYAYDLGKLLAYLVKQLNNRYDLMGVVYLVILKLAGRAYPRAMSLANAWQRDRDYFCSELCCEAFSFAGLDIVPWCSRGGNASPADIAQSDVVEKVEVEAVEMVAG